MTTETMTVTQGLKELKLAASKINSDIKNTAFIATKKSSASKINNMTTEEFNTYTVGKLASIEDNIKRRRAIKSAIAQSNASAIVTIDGKDFYVAEAIELKTSLSFQKSMLDVITTQHRMSLTVESRENLDAEAKALAAVAGTLTAQATDGKKADVSDAKRAVELRDSGVTTVFDSVYNKLKTSVIDPLNVVAVMSRLSTEIDNYERVVDTSLAVANATTVITISY